MTYKIVLFANTGMGNHVLGQLLSMPYVSVKMVVTSCHSGCYPYYRIKELFRYSRNLNIKTLCDINVNTSEFIQTLTEINPDFVIVASFNQILKKDLLGTGYTFINLHPSILPNYRGPSPIHWVLLNGETKTGITAHYINEGIDTGAIIDKEHIGIKSTSTINKLVKNIHKRSGILIKRVIDKMQETHKRDNLVEKGKYYKRPIGYDIINDEDDITVVYNKIRAFGFFPGIVYKNKRILVRKIIFNTKNEIIVFDKKNLKTIISINS